MVTPAPSVAAPADDDILRQVMTADPVDTRYVAGRWHRDRVHWRGVWTEAKVFGKTLLLPQKGASHKFLIISRARSGSTLLTDLLNSHPEVQCDREVLHSLVLAPAVYLDRLAAKSPKFAYGAKVLSYQMVQVQRFRDPRRFLAGLAGRGFRLIHLERETFAQTLSLYVAGKTRRYHSVQKRDIPTAVGPREIDPADFVRRLEWNDLLLRYERWCLRELPHLHLGYEDDLMTEERQRDSAARIFDWIGVANAPVQSALKKILPGDPTTMIANYDAVAAATRAHGLGHLLPDATSP